MVEHEPRTFTIEDTPEPEPEPESQEPESPPAGWTAREMLDVLNQVEALGSRIVAAVANGTARRFMANGGDLLALLRSHLRGEPPPESPEPSRNGQHAAEESPLQETSLARREVDMEPVVDLDAAIDHLKTSLKTLAALEPDLRLADLPAKLEENMPMVKREFGRMLQSCIRYREAAG